MSKSQRRVSPARGTSRPKLYVGRSEKLADSNLSLAEHDYFGWKGSHARIQFHFSVAEKIVVISSEPFSVSNDKTIEIEAARIEIN
jgi:hypothetical protein